MPGTLKSKENTLSRLPRKFAYCRAFNLSFVQNPFFPKVLFFIQGDFKNIQGLLWKIACANLNDDKVERKANGNTCT